MKTQSANRFLITLILFLAFGFISQVYSQDKVIMLSGEEKTGKVTGLESDAIKFVHSGEELEYTLKKSEIEKIVFESGRTEVINSKEAVLASQPKVASASERRNKIAVLPFEVTTNDPSIETSSMGTHMQNDCVMTLRSEKAGIYEVQDAITTNSLLRQHGVDLTQTRIISPKEMAEILGVEYVLYGTYDIQNKGARSYGSSVTTYKEKEEREARDKKTKGTEISSNNSSTTIEYDTRVTLSTFNDQGNNVYSESRSPFGSGVDSYMSSLKYLLKRSPFGTKH